MLELRFLDFLEPCLPHGRPISKGGVIPGLESRSSQVGSIFVPVSLVVMEAMDFRVMMFHWKKKMSDYSGTAKQARRWFNEGANAAIFDDGEEEKVTCPYPEESTAEDFWTLGYSYEARQLNAVRYRIERDDFKRQLEKFNAS